MWEQEPSSWDRRSKRGAAVLFREAQGLGDRLGPVPHSGFNPFVVLLEADRAFQPVAGRLGAGLEQLAQTLLGAIDDPQGAEQT